MKRGLLLRYGLLVAMWCALPCAAYAQPAAAANTSTVETSSASAPAPETITFEKGDYRRIKSIFFTTEEMTDIRLAINTYNIHFSGRTEEAEFNEEDFLNQLTGLRRSPKTNRFFVYPQFFLESLVYHAANNWAVWVNGQKFTQDTPVENTKLRIKTIDPNQVVLEWYPVDMEKVNEVWARAPNTEVQVDKLEGKVQFSLRPNQTFSSYVMRVVEGKVQPVTVDNTVNGLTAEGEEKAPSPEQPQANENADKTGKREGLGGLIGAYSGIKSDTGAPPPSSLPQHPKPSSPKEKKP